MNYDDIVIAVFLARTHLKPNVLCVDVYYQTDANSYEFFKSVSFL